MNPRLIVLLMMICTYTYAQEIPATLDISDVKEWYSFIQKSIKYPVQAKRLGIEGPVYVAFDVDETGSVVNVRLLKSLYEPCDLEVRRVMAETPSGYLKVLSDKVKRNKFILPVFFWLDRAPKKARQIPQETNSLMLPPVDVLAGGLVITRREIGTGVTTTVSRMPMDEPVVITYTSLNDALEKPKAVKRLSLRSQQLTTFPNDILELKNLDFLDLEQNQLQSLPAELSTLASLKELYLMDNQLTSLPEDFGSLKKLKTLGLSSNQLKSFPIQLTALEKLETLDLSNNQLSSIPPEIGLMKNLKTIVLVYNALTKLPPEFYTLKKVKVIYLQGNPLSADDISLLKKTFKNSEIGF